MGAVHNTKKIYIYISINPQPPTFKCVSENKITYPSATATNVSVNKKHPKKPKIFKSKHKITPIQLKYFNSMF